MASSEKFCLRWNDFEANISGAFREIRDEKDFFDVTLACEDDSQLQAHKVILSACSPFFRTVLRRNPHQHPLLYLKGVKSKELMSVLNFMYCGEVNVAQEELNSFLAVSEDLQVKGLTQGGAGQGGTKPETAKLPPLPRQEARRPRPAPVPAPLQSYPQYADTDEIQEVVPVKCEPSGAGEQQAVVGAGAVALDESQYHEEEGYGEYGEWDGDTGLDPSGLQDGNKDLDEQIDFLSKRQPDGTWWCSECGYSTKIKTNLRMHVESKHLVSSGFKCEICQTVCPNRKSLRNHVDRRHKKQQ